MIKLHEIPPRVNALPRNASGYPVPWFVAWIDGVPDFRVIAAGKLATAVRDNKCWICGQKLGKYRAFVIGPMCAVNRVSSEPPSHRECAIFAAKACPFLTLPKMKRREKGLPAEAIEMAGIALKRNPGVTLVWITTTDHRFPAPGGSGFLFDVGTPLETLWFAEGREATREEVLESMASGLPDLEEIAGLDEGGLEALEAAYTVALALAPAGSPPGEIAQRPAALERQP